MSLKQAFECEEGTSFLSCEIENDLLTIAIEDSDEDESPYVSIGLSQVANLIEYLLRVRRCLPARSSEENLHVLR